MAVRKILSAVVAGVVVVSGARVGEEEQTRPQRALVEEEAQRESMAQARQPYVGGAMGGFGMGGYGGYAGGYGGYAGYGGAAMAAAPVAPMAAAPVAAAPVAAAATVPVIVVERNHGPGGPRGRRDFRHGNGDYDDGYGYRGGRGPGGPRGRHGGYGRRGDYYSASSLAEVESEAESESQTQVCAERYQLTEVMQVLGQKMDKNFLKALHTMKNEEGDKKCPEAKVMRQIRELIGVDKLM